MRNALESQNIILSATTLSENALTSKTVSMSLINALFNA